MTNKLVVIINSLKYQKLRKFYYMKWNFLYQITAASRTPDYGATAPRSSFSLSSTEFVELPPNKIPGYATVCLDYTYRLLQRSHNSALYKQAVWDRVVRIETALRAGMSRVWNAGGTRDISLLQRFQIGFGAHLRLNGYRGSFHGANEPGPEFHIVPR